MELFTLDAVLNLVSDGFMGGVSLAKNAMQGLIDLAGDVADTGLGFDRAMGTVEAILGPAEATADNMERLRNFALEQARSSIFTGEQAAEAYTYMGMAGWKAQEMNDGLPGIMSLAAASGEDLGTVSDIVTDSLTAFGLTAKDTQEYVDVLAKTATNSNTNVAMMGEAFKYAAPLANALGFSYKDVAVELGLMANAGVKSSQAGTTLRRLFADMNGPIDIVGEKLGHVTVETTNTDGSMRELSDILMDVGGAFDQLTESEKVHAAENIAGKVAMSGFLGVMNAADEDVDKLSAAIDDAAGAAQRMADTRLDNLPGSLDMLGSAWDGLKQKIYDDQKGPFKEVVDWATESLNDISDAIGEEGIAGGIETLGDKIREMGEDENVQELLESIGGLMGAILDGAIAHVLPAVKAAAPEVMQAFMSGLGSSGGGASSAIYGIGSFLFDFLGSKGSRSEEIFREKIGDIEIPAEIAPHLDKDLVWRAFDEAIQNGKAEVDIGKALNKNGESWVVTYEEAQRIASAIDSSVTDGGAAGATNLEGILETTGDTVENQLIADIGSAGVPAGNDLASGIWSVLSNTRFSVAVDAVVNGLPQGANVRRNASAMTSGRIFNRPTVFGYADGAYQVAGDAGPEAVVGVNSLSGMIASAVRSAIPVVTPGSQPRQLNVILELDRRELARTVYELNKQETQRVGMSFSNARL